MKKVYEDSAKIVRWLIASVFALIVALPTFTSVSTSI